jgi:hypothetical protein
MADGSPRKERRREPTRKSMISAKGTSKDASGNRAGVG